VFLDITLKNNTEVAKSKCYAFASSTLLRLFFTSNFKIDNKYFAPPEIFFALPPRLCWVGYGSGGVPSGYTLDYYMNKKKTITKNNFYDKVSWFAAPWLLYFK